MTFAHPSFDSAFQVGPNQRNGRGYYHKPQLTGKFVVTFLIYA